MEESITFAPNRDKRDSIVYQQKHNNHESNPQSTKLFMHPDKDEEK